MTQEQRQWEPTLAKAKGTMVQRGIQRSSYAPYQTGQLEAERQQRLADYERKYGKSTGSVERSYGRSMEDWQQQESMTRRDNTRALEEAVETGVLQRKEEAQRRWEEMRNKWYDSEATPY